MRSIRTAATWVKGLALAASIAACRLVSRAGARTADGLARFKTPASDAAAAAADRG